MGPLPGHLLPCTLRSTHTCEQTDSYTQRRDRNPLPTHEYTNASTPPKRIQRHTSRPLDIATQTRTQHWQAARHTNTALKAARSVASLGGIHNQFPSLPTAGVISPCPSPAEDPSLIASRSGNHPRPLLWKGSRAQAGQHYLRDSVAEQGVGPRAEGSWMISTGTALPLTAGSFGHWPRFRL